METILPSEIARLVLGYLKEENCQETSKLFVRECPHLREYLGLLNEGREFSTEVLGLSLKMILDEYGNMKLSRRTQASPALANLWDRYELMGSQLRQSITPSVNQTPQSSASRLVNNMHTFSRRQGSRNRYSSARTEGVLVVRSEVSVTTSNAPANTPRRGTHSNTRGSYVPTMLPHTTSVPSGVPLGGQDGRAAGWSLPGRGSHPSSQRGDDDLESVVSVGGMSSSTCDQIESNVVTDHTVMDDPRNECYNQTLNAVDSVQRHGRVTPTPAKIISPTSRSPLSSTQLTASTPGNFSKKSQQSTGSLVATDNTGAAQKSLKPSRRIQSKIINGGTDLSPIRALTSTSTTSCRATPVTSRCSGRVSSYDSTTLCNYGTVVSSSSVPVTTCYTATDALSQKDGVTMWNPVALSAGAGDSIVLNPVMAIDNKTSPFHLFPLGSGDFVPTAASSSYVPSSVSCPLVPDGSCRSVTTTSLDSVPVYTVPFNSCDSSPFTSAASTGFDFVPVTCDMVPVTSYDSVPSHQLTVTSVPVMSCKLDKAQTRETVAPSVTDNLGTPSKQTSFSSFQDNGIGDNVDALVPRTPVRSRRHLSKEFNSPRDRRKKAQPCKRRASVETTSASGCNSSASTSSISHSIGSAPTIDSNLAKGDLPELVMNEMLERLISSHSIAEKIAENINHRLTTQNTSRSNPVTNTDDPGSSNCPGTTPNTTNESLSHRTDLAEDSASNFESNQGQNHHERRDYHRERNEAGVITCESVVSSHSGGDNNGSVNEIAGALNNTTLAVDTGIVVHERNALLQESQLEQLNPQQSGRPHDETVVSDLSCTSLLSMSNLDQMTDDAIRFVFDQLCNDPNLDSICSMTSSSFHHTERADVDSINSISLSNQTSAIHFSSHVEQLVNSTPLVNHGTSTTCEIPSSPTDVDFNPPDPFALDPSVVPLASASVGFDTRRRYIQVCFPGEGERPDRIDIVEVIGSGVEMSNGQPSPDNTSTIADGSQTLPLVDSGQETASENPMLLSSQDMSSYLQSSTDVASTLADDGSTSVWPSTSDPTTHEGEGDTFVSRTTISSSLGYFSDCDVVVPTDLPIDGSERAAAENVDSSLNAARLEMQTIAEHDLVELKTSNATRNSHEVVQHSDELSILDPSSAKVLSNTSSSAVESGLCRRREKSAADYSPSKLTESGWTFNKSKRKKLHSGNSMRTPAVELKLNEKTGIYRLTNYSMEKKKQLGFGVPGKISGNKTPELVTTAVGAETTLTCDVGQLHLTSSNKGTSSGSVPTLKTPDFNADCIAISEVLPLHRNLEENCVVERKETRGRNLSKKQFRVLNRSRGPSTPSSISTGILTVGTISGPSTPSRSTVDPLTSIDVPSTPGRAVGGTFNGSTAVPSVSGVAVGSAGCSGDPVTSNVITSLPAASSECVVDLCTSSCSQSPRGPTESAKVPSILTDCAITPSNFARCVIVPASDDTINTNPQKPCSAASERSRTNEKNTSKHNAQFNARQTKSESGVVYFEQDALSPRTDNQECLDLSSLSVAIPSKRMPEFSPINPLANEKPHKAKHRSKKKAKHIRDSDKNTSSRTDKKRKSHSAHNSVDKRANKSEKAEQSNPVSHSRRKIDDVEKECKMKQKEPLSNVIQITDSSEDDDLPIAHFLKSGVCKELPSRNTKSNTQLVTETLRPKSTLQETVGANKILDKDKKSDCSMQVNNSSSTQMSCQGLGQKVKAAIEKQSKESSAISLDDTSLSVTPNCSLQPNASDVLSSQAVQLNSGEKVSSCGTNGPCSVALDSNVGSEMVSGDNAEKSVLTNPVLSTKTNWNKFKIPKYQNSSLGMIFALNTDINSSASHHSSESVTVKSSKSMEHILYERWTSKTSVDSRVVTPAKSHSTSVEIPLESTSKSRTESHSGSSKSIEHILSGLRKTAVGTAGIAPPDSRIKSAKTPAASTPKPVTAFPADRWKTLEPILSDDRTSKTAAETSGIARPKSRITSSQKTSIAFTPKPRTVSPLTTSSSIQPPKKSESISRKSKSPQKSASGKTQKQGSSGRSIQLCEAENQSVRKHSRPKSPKTKKSDQAFVSKHPVPSLLSRANKVHELSTYKMSCDTLLSMPSSFEGLIQLAEANRTRVLYDDSKPTQIDTETKRSETNVLHSASNPSVGASHPLESGDGRHDDVDIASALLSLSSAVPGDSRCALVPQNVLSTRCGNSSAERTFACVANSESGLEIHRDPNLVDDTRNTNLTSSDLAIVNPRLAKDSMRLSQAERACVDDSGAIDLTVAARDFHLDECCTKNLRTSSFSSPSIGLVLNINEGTETLSSSSSSPSASISACPSVPESHVDENPNSWPSQEVPKPSRKRNRSTSADSDSRAKKLKIRKQLKSLDITAFLKQLHQPKNSD